MLAGAGVSRSMFDRYLGPAPVTVTMEDLRLDPAECAP
jgi:hypothetical protein